MNTRLTILLTALALTTISTACQSGGLRPFKEEGEIPPLMKSKKTSGEVVTPITGSAFPISDEYSPMVVDDHTVIFVSDFNKNLDVFTFDYTSDKESGQVEVVVTQSDEKSPSVVNIINAGGMLETRCVYVSNASRKFEIYSGDLPRVKIQSTVHSPTGNANWPAFDESGERMLFSTIGRDGEYFLMLRDEDGVKHMGHGQRARWNPTRPNVFVYTAKTGKVWQIFERNVITDETTTLTAGTSDNFDPQYSRDGNHIAFTSNRQGSSDIWIMNADGSEPKSATEHGAADCQPDWSPNGRWLIFASDRGKTWDLWKTSSGLNSESAESAPE